MGIMMEIIVAVCMGAVVLVTGIFYKIYVYKAFEDKGAGQ